MSVHLNAGDLDQQITLQAPASTVDALGQRVESWSDVATVWARALPLRGREFFAAGQTQSEATVRFVLRYRSDIAANMRVLWRGLAHAVIGDPIDVGGQKVALELMCTAGVKDGR